MKNNEDNKNDNLNNSKTAVIINCVEQQIKLVPGPVYCFYSETKFQKNEAYPTIQNFFKKVASANIESVVLKGKPVVDPYVLDWQYKNAVYYDKVIAKMESRSYPALKEKAIKKINQNKEKELKKYQKDSSNYKEFEEKYNSLIKETNRYYDELISDRYIYNKKYFENFSEEEIEQFKHYQTKDIKRLAGARNRNIVNLEEIRGFIVELKPSIIRFATPIVNRRLARAMKRNKRWKRKAPYFNINRKDIKKALNALNDTKIGMLGSEKVNLVDNNKTIGENLVKIIRVVKGCSFLEAKNEALELLTYLELYDPQNVYDSYLYQFINNDYHYKILLSYVLAYSPEVIIVDKSALNTNRNLTKDLYKFIVQVQEKYKFIFVIYDDSIFDKDFENMITYKVTKDGDIELMK